MVHVHLNNQSIALKLRSNFLRTCGILGMKLFTEKNSTQKISV